MMEDAKIAVVIPAFRVATQIEEVITKMPECVDRIFVVDDASPDGLADAVMKLTDSRLRLLRHEKNQGVGGATVTGMKAALEEGADIVVKCDGDGQMDPSDIPLLLAPILAGIADHAKGCRFHQFRALKTMPRRRLIGNIALTFLTKLASGYWNILDPVNGYLATRAEILKQLRLSRLDRRYFFETDFLIELNIVEARVADIPLAARYGNESSALSIFRTILEFPVKLMAGLVRRIFWRYLFYDVSPIAIFTMLGLLLFGFGVGFGLYHWIVNAIRGAATPLGTVILAALPCILGFQLLLQSIVLDIGNTPRMGGPAPRSHGVLNNRWK
jgi:glycosyltransferase involved in cell wall biosynthesis